MLSKINWTLKDEIVRHAFQPESLTGRI